MQCPPLILFVALVPFAGIFLDFISERRKQPVFVTMFEFLQFICKELPGCNCWGAIKRTDWNDTEAAPLKINQMNPEII